MARLAYIAGHYFIMLFMNAKQLTLNLYDNYHLHVINYQAEAAIMRKLDKPAHLIL